jgi:peptide/nickel transport system ATP-binding protein
VVADGALEVRDLTVTVRSFGRTATLLENVNFSIPPGGTLGVVGESGSGKTMTALAMMRLLPREVNVAEGKILFGGEDLLRKSKAQMRRIRGSKIGMVLQDPTSSLDPSFTVGNQLGEAFRLHQRLRGRELKGAMLAALEQVEIPSPKERLRQYPHQLSGGMRQRVISAIALACQPRLLIADEPTTALDVTTQAAYLRLLRELQHRLGFSLMLIAHDLSIVREMCERVVVMYAGQVVEQGDVEGVFQRPRHPYTQALLRAIPALGADLELESIEGQAPEPWNRPAGCRFAPRCAFVRAKCATPPALIADGTNGRLARCWGTAPNGWLEP